MFSTLLWMTWHIWQSCTCLLEQNLALFKKIWLAAESKEWTAVCQGVYQTEQIKTLQKFMCNLRQTNKEHKKIMSSCPHAKSQAAPGYHPNI